MQLELRCVQRYFVLLAVCKELFCNTFRCNSAFGHCRSWVLKTVVPDIAPESNTCWENHARWDEGLKTFISFFPRLSAQGMVQAERLVEQRVIFCLKERVPE